MNSKILKTKNRGFTLIELLVVISIIGLLSVIVMGSMEDARNRARNSAKNSLVKEYLKALELYRVSRNSQNTHYKALTTARKTSFPKHRNLLLINNLQRHGVIVSEFTP